MGQIWYADKVVPGKTFPVLIRMATPEDAASAKLLFDPAVFDPQGLTAPDFWKPSFDGKQIAISLSRKGSEEGTLTVLDVASARSAIVRRPMRWRSSWTAWG